MKPVESPALSGSSKKDFTQWKGYGLSIVFLALATLAVSFGSQTPPAKSIVSDDTNDTTPSVSVNATLTSAERQWASAHTKGNPSELAPLLSHDFVATDAAGTVRSGRSYLQTLIPTKAPSATPTAPSLDIRVYGQMAVVIGQIKTGGHTERFTHIYQHHNMTWQMVASQATRLKG